MLADRMKTLAPSPTLAMQAKARAMRAQGIDVISFGAGEPDLDTRADQAAAIRALETGQTKYAARSGVPGAARRVCQAQAQHGLRRCAPDEGPSPAGRSTRSTTS
jgi:aspartate aminotransferase